MIQAEDYNEFYTEYHYLSGEDYDQFEEEVLKSIGTRKFKDELDSVVTRSYSTKSSTLSAQRPEMNLHSWHTA